MSRILVPPLILAVTYGALNPPEVHAQEAADSIAIERLVGDYVRGWREADVELLSQVFAQEGIVMWVSGENERLQTLTFAEVLQNQRPRPGYGEPWRLLSLDVVDAKVAVAKVRIADGTVRRR